MILSRKYARALLRKGKAKLIGKTTSEGTKFYIIDRLDIQRVDHFKVDP